MTTLEDRAVAIAENLTGSVYDDNANGSKPVVVLLLARASIPPVPPRAMNPLDLALSLIALNADRLNMILGIVWLL